MGLFSRNKEVMAQEWVVDTRATLRCRASIGTFSQGTRIIAGTKGGKLVCLTPEGETVWVFSAGEDLSEMDQYFVDEEKVHSFDAPPLIADVNHDGKNEIVVGSEMGVLYCLSEDGNLLWQYEVGSIRAAPLAADVNMDGHLEILVGSADKKLIVLSGTGELIFEYDTDSPVECTPGVMKSRGKTLIVFGTDAGELHAITPMQDAVWTVKLGSKVTASPAFFATAEEQRLVIGTIGGSMFCVSEHGEVVWEFKTEGSIYNAAALHDLNDDGAPEIVFGSCDNTVYALTTAGKRVWSYETDFWVTDTPLIADIDGDGTVEVIAGSYDHNVYVLDSQGEYMMDYVPGISGIVPQAGHYANVLTSDPGEQTGKKRFMFKADSIVVGCALLQTKPARVVVCTKTGHIQTLRGA